MKINILYCYFLLLGIFACKNNTESDKKVVSENTVITIDLKQKYYKGDLPDFDSSYGSLGYPNIELKLEDRESFGVAGNQIDYFKLYYTNVSDQPRGTKSVLYELGMGYKPTSHEKGVENMLKIVKFMGTLERDSTQIKDWYNHRFDKNSIPKIGVSTCNFHLNKNDVCFRATLLPDFTAENQVGIQFEVNTQFEN